MTNEVGVRGIDHFNLDVPPEHLDTVCAFYENAVGLKNGFRPIFDFDGRWLYADGIDNAVVHLASYGVNEPAPLQQTSGRLNHICFAMQGLNDHRSRLTSQGIAFRESDRPGAVVVQLFLQDPTGVTIELNFSKALEGLPLPEATA
ncbi:MAG: VOC family protein [Burkholderiaceae bacterium]